MVCIYFTWQPTPFSGLVCSSLTEGTGASRRYHWSPTNMYNTYCSWSCSLLSSAPALATSLQLVVQTQVSDSVRLRLSLMERGELRPESPSIDPVSSKCTAGKVDANGGGDEAPKGSTEKEFETWCEQLQGKW